MTYEIKTEDVCEDFSKVKEMFDFSSYWAKSKYCDDSSKVIASKMKEETGSVTVEKFIGLSPKMQKIYLFLVHDISRHKKTKSVNKNVVARIIVNARMLFWIIIVSNIRWIELKVKIIKEEPSK